MLAVLGYLVCTSNDRNVRGLEKMINYKSQDDQGKLHTDLANIISVVIDNAIRGGMQPAEALQTTAFVCADYARTTYGDESIALLTKVMADRADDPTPETTSSAIH